MWHYEKKKKCNLIKKSMKVHRLFYVHRVDNSETKVYNIKIKEKGFEEIDLQRRRVDRVAPLAEVGSSS